MAGWICNRCNGAIVTAECRRSNDKTYHVECFTCAICDSPIDGSTRQIKTSLQEVYCLECHQKYFQDVSRHSIFGSHVEQEHQDASPAGDGQQEVVPVPMEIKASFTIIDPTDSTNPTTEYSRESASEVAIKAMLHKYSTPVHSIHEIMPPPLLASVKRAVKTKAASGVAKPLKIPEATRNLMKEQETNNLSSFDPNPNNDSTPIMTPLASTPKKKLIRARSRIPVLTPVSSRTQVEDPATPARTPSLTTPRRNRTDMSSRVTRPFTTPTSSAANDYIKNKVRRGQDGSTPRPPSRKGTPMKATHSLPGNSQSKAKSDYPKSQSSMSTDATFSRQFSAGSVCSGTCRRSDSQASACTTFVIPRNSSQKLRGSSSKSERASSAVSCASNIPSQPQFMSWNNLHVSPAELPSTQQLLSLMLHQGEKGRPDSGGMSRTSTAGSCRSRNGCLDCPICYEGLIDEKPQSRRKFVENVVTECGHIFHRECITNWLVTNGNTKCPICLKMCERDSLIPIYLDANATVDSKSSDNGLASLVATLRWDYKELMDKYNCLLKEHQDCGVKCAISDSLKAAYEVECRNRVELQWENKRLHRKIDELQGKIKSAQGDTVAERHDLCED